MVSRCVSQDLSAEQALLYWQLFTGHSETNISGTQRGLEGEWFEEAVELSLEIEGGKEHSLWCSCQLDGK